MIELTLLHLLLIAYKDRAMEHLGEGERFTAEQVAGAMNKAIEETMEVIRDKFQTAKIATKKERPS